MEPDINTIKIRVLPFLIIKTLSCSIPKGKTCLTFDDMYASSIHVFNFSYSRLEGLLYFGVNFVTRNNFGTG